MWSKPYKSRLDNIVEGFNEVCILLSLYMYLMFTLDDYEIKYYAGQTLILITLINLGCNVLLIILRTLLNFIRKVRLWFLKRQALREKKKKDAEDKLHKLNT